MPSHIYVQLGMYYQAMYCNDIANKHDLKFLTTEGKLNSTAYMMYTAHNLHVKIYASMLMGHHGHAMEAVEMMDFLFTDDIVRACFPGGGPPYILLIDAQLAHKYMVWIRFGKWDRILEEPLKEDKDLYLVVTCTAHYARSLAHALGKGDLAKAKAEQDLFEASYAALPRGKRILHNNDCKDILAVSQKMLSGELAYREGKHDEAFALLREAGHLEHSPPEGVLKYDEPWGYMQPSRHALGALLMEQGRFKEAEQAYKEDLGLDLKVPRCYRHPDNVWGLHGLCEALQKQGHPDAELERRRDLALARSDASIMSSCFCRKHCC